MNRPIILRSFAGVFVAAVVALSGCGNEDDRGAVRPREAASGVSRAAIEKSLAAAEEYVQADDLPRAEAILLTLIDRAPDEAAAHELHGQVLLARAAEARHRGDLAASTEFAQRAYERYRKVIEHSPPSAGLHHSAGDIAIAAGLNDQALDHYRQAMRLDPLQPRHAIFAAQLLAEAKRFDEAEEALRDALALDPDEPIAHASLANIAMQRGNFDEALEHIREARSIRPGDVSFRVIEAAIHRRAGEPRNAVAILVGLPREQQAQRTVAQELAAGYADLGDHGSAAAVLARSFQASANDRDAWTLALAAAKHFLDADRREDAMHWANQSRLAATTAGVPDTGAIEAFERRLASNSAQENDRR